MARGKATPTVAIVGSQGRLIINECDLPEWRSRGYRLESEPPVESQEDAAPGNTNAPEDPVVPMVNPLEEMTVPALKARAEELGLFEVAGKPVSQAKKSQLIEAIGAVVLE